MNVEIYYLKPLTLEEVARCQEFGIKLWSDWKSNNLFVSKTYWQTLHPNVREAVITVIEGKTDDR